LHYVLIYNPVSGRGKAMTMSRRIADLLKARKHQVTLIATDPDPKVFRAKCLEFEKDIIAVVVGGDGTLRYFIQNMGEVAGVAFYGMGTANVLRFELGYPNQPEAFVDVLENPRTRLIRPGLIDQKTPFIMMYSIGRDSYVLSKASQSMKNRIGKLAFFWPALKSLFYKAPKFQLALDDQPPVEAHFAIVSRIRYYAGPFMLTPSANPTSDGFQVVMVRGSGFWPFLKFFLALVFGRLKNDGRTTITFAKTVHFPDLPQGLYAQMDGDPLPKAFATLSVSNKAIPFIVPSV